MSRLAAWLGRGWQARRTIRVRLTLWYVALLALVLLVFSGALYVGLARGLQAEADARLTIAGQQVLALIDIEDDALDEPITPEQLPPGIVVTVHARGGQPLFSTDQAAVLPRLSREEARAIDGGWMITIGANLRRTDPAEGLIW